MLWTVLLLLVLVVVIGVAFQIGSSWMERIILASFFCALVVYGFYRLTGQDFLGP